VAAGVAVLSGGVSAVVCCGGEKGLQVFRPEKDSIDRVRRKLCVCVCVCLLAVQSTEAMPAGQAGRQWNPPTYPRTQQYQRHPAVPAAPTHSAAFTHPPHPTTHLDCVPGVVCGSAGALLGIAGVLTAVLRAGR
jgi:hypothetical protein